MRQFLDDLRWAWLMVQARRFRRNHGFLARRRFDDALRPVFSVTFELGNMDDPGAVSTVYAYPDAVYFVDKSDLRRAVCAAKQQGTAPWPSSSTVKR
jgi:hypothetical protein